MLPKLLKVVPLADGEMYFMPCAITNLMKSLLLTSLATIPPLLITFSSRNYPQGLLEKLRECLVNKHVANSPLIVDESESHNNQICFTMGLQKLFLKSNDVYIYTELILDEEDRELSSDLCTMCNIIRKLIEDNIAKAYKTLGYSSSATYRLSFKCQCSPMEEYHLAELRTDDPLKQNFFFCTRFKKKAPVTPECYAWLPDVSR